MITLPGQPASMLAALEIWLGSGERTERRLHELATHYGTLNGYDTATSAMLVRQLINSLRERKPFLFQDQP